MARVSPVRSAIFFARCPARRLCRSPDGTRTREAVRQIGRIADLDAGVSRRRRTDGARARAMDGPSQSRPLRHLLQRAIADIDRGWCAIDIAIAPIALTSSTSRVGAGAPTFVGPR